MVEGAKSKKRKVVVSPNGKACVYTTYNNIIVTITNEHGDVISWSSAGKNDFKNTKKKNTPYAGQIVGTDCAKKAFDYGVKNVDVIVKGPGTGRETAIKAIADAGINVMSIIDKTPVPHGGCRTSKRRRN